MRLTTSKNRINEYQAKGRAISVQPGAKPTPQLQPGTSSTPTQSAQQSNDYMRQQAAAGNATPPGVRTIAAPPKRPPAPPADPNRPMPVAHPPSTSGAWQQGGARTAGAAQAQLDSSRYGAGGGWVGYGQQPKMFPRSTDMAARQQGDAGLRNAYATPVSASMLPGYQQQGMSPEQMADAFTMGNVEFENPYGDQGGGRREAPLGQQPKMFPRSTDMAARQQGDAGLRNAYATPVSASMLPGYQQQGMSPEQMADAFAMGNVEFENPYGDQGGGRREAPLVTGSSGSGLGSANTQTDSEGNLVDSEGRPIDDSPGNATSDQDISNIEDPALAQYVSENGLSIDSNGNIYRDVDGDGAYGPDDEDWGNRYDPSSWHRAAANQAAGNTPYGQQPGADRFGPKINATSWHQYDKGAPGARDLQDLYGWEEGTPPSDGRPEDMTAFDINSTPLNADDYIAAMRKQRAADMSRNIRASMEAGGAAGMSPEAMTGMMAGLQQTAQLEGNVAEEKARLDIDIQNKQLEMNRLQMELQDLMQRRELTHDEKMRKYLDAQITARQQMMQGHEREMAELRHKWETEFSASDVIGGLLGGGMNLLGMIL